MDRKYKVNYTIRTLFIFCFGLSCTSSKIVGKYVLSISQFTKDTLILRGDNVYIHKVFSLDDSQLVYNTSNWSLANGKVELDSFYINYDRPVQELSYSKGAITSSLMFISVDLKDNDIIIDWKRNVYYRKID